MYCWTARSASKKILVKRRPSPLYLDYRRQSPVARFFVFLTMTQKRIHPAPRKPRARARRKPRADAQRNRERILEMAKQAFTRSGADASLDDIATQAGVGAGTLYRHFPTREALLAAVYRTEVEKLAAAEKRLAGELAPLEALRAWMLLFVDYIATKKIIAPALSAMVGEHSKVIEAGYAQIQGAIRALVKRAKDGRRDARRHRPD